jgi:predicted phosphate transport protein (TIGR00153 family)
LNDGQSVSSLLHWFKERRNQIILKTLDEHTGKLVDTCTASLELLELLKSTDQSKAEKLYNRVSMQERSADHFQDDLATEIARGMLPPEIREKLFRLTRVADSVANWIKSGSKNLVLLVKLEVDTSEFDMILDYLIEIVKLTHESVVIFRKMVNALGTDDQLILDTRQIIEDREREADNVHFSVREEILAINDKQGFSVHFLLIDAAKCLENASDSITNAADILYTIVMLGIPT